MDAHQHDSSGYSMMCHRSIPACLPQNGHDQTVNAVIPFTITVAITAEVRRVQDSVHVDAPQMKELREMLGLLKSALADKGGGVAVAAPEDELRDLERQIARQKKVAQVRPGVVNWWTPPGCTGAARHRVCALKGSLPPGSSGMFSAPYNLLLHAHHLKG